MGFRVSGFRVSGLQGLGFRVMKGLGFAMISTQHPMRAIILVAWDWGFNILKSGGHLGSIAFHKGSRRYKRASGLGTRGLYSAF